MANDATLANGPVETDAIDGYRRRKFVYNAEG